MCKHCEKLSEDKEVVHRFAESAAKRINEKWQREDGSNPYPVMADDLSIKIEVTKKRGNAYTILGEMDQ